MDGNNTYCDICGFRAENKHAWAVHIKGMTHQRAVQSQEERSAAREEKLEKEEKDARFVGHWQPLLLPHYRSYEEAVQDTIGPLYPRPTLPACADLTESVMQMYAITRPRPHVVLRRKAIYKFVFRVCKALFPDATLDVFGSIPHKLDGETSDIDMSISPVAGMEDAHVLARIAKAIECCQSPYLQVTRILHARIPVISIVDSLADGLHLDLSIWNVDKLHISTIFATYMEIDVRLRPLIFCVRLWSKVRGINDAFSG